MQPSERLDPVAYVTESAAVGMYMVDSGGPASDTGKSRALLFHFPGVSGQIGRSNSLSSNFASLIHFTVEPGTSET